MYFALSGGKLHKMSKWVEDVEKEALAIYDENSESKEDEEDFLNPVLMKNQVNERVN